MISTKAILKTRRGSIDVWNKIESPFAGSVEDVSYGNGVWVIVSSKNEIAVSIGTIPDEFTLVASPFVAGTRIFSIEFGNGYFVIFDHNNLRMATSVDGSVWTLNTSTNTTAYVCRDSEFGDGKFMVSVQFKANSTPYVFTAVDPTGKWTATGLPIPLGAPTTSGMCYGGGYWYIKVWGYSGGGSSSGSVYSTNGTSWTYLSEKPAFDYAQFTYNGTQWIAAGNASYCYTTGSVTSWSSTNYIIPYYVPIHSYITARGIEYGNGVVMITGGSSTGSSGLVYNSNALPSYFTEAAGTAGSFQNSHYNGNFWVAVGSKSIYYSGPGV